MLPRITIPHISDRLNVLMVCQMVLLLFLSLAVLLYFSRQTLKDEARNDAEQTLMGTEQHIDNILMTVEQTAYNNYQDIRWHLDQPDRMFTYCRKIVETYPYIVGCAIAFKPNYYPGRELFMAYVHRSGNEQGNASMVSAGKFGNRPYTEQLWYTLPMSTGHACWTDPLPEEEDEGVTLSFCLPILVGHASQRDSDSLVGHAIPELCSPTRSLSQRDSECVGVLVVDLPVSLLSQIVHSVKPSPNSYSVLLSSNGSYIVHPDAEKLSKMKTVFELADRNADPSIREAAKAMIAGETGFMSFRMNQKNWYVFYKPFQHTVSIDQPMDQLGWSAGVVYLKDDILGSYNFLVWVELAIAILSVLLFFLLCRMLIRRQLKPLHTLTRSAQRIAEGHYDETVPSAQCDDEIGQLQDCFQRMQQSLRGKSSELEQLTSMLKVRGEELRKAYGNAQGSDRMKTTFLHYMTTQMTVPADLIERSVMKLSNNYQNITPEEAEAEVSVIKKQSETVLNVLEHMIEALQIEAEESEKELKAGKEADHE